MALAGTTPISGVKSNHSLPNPLQAQDCSTGRLLR
jgi:hypothetical protein